MTTSANLSYTPIQEIPVIYDTLRKTFASGVTKPLAWRRHQLLQLARLVQDNSEALADSLLLDLGRPKTEAYMADISPIVKRCITCAEKLEEWSAPEDFTSQVPDWQKAWSPRVEKSPKGTVLVIGPWNYPIILSLQPLFGAISAGCCAVLKTSEVAPHYASLISTLIPKYLDSSAYRVVSGAVPEITKLLELKWDHIFYTGNGRVGRIISAAAAKHLTPVTLELGGKSPVIIDPSYDLDLAAKRILWGKINNAGQICVSPDYVLATPASIPTLVSAFKKHMSSFFPEGAFGSTSYGRIVSEPHFERLKEMLQKTKGRIVAGGKVEEKDEAAKHGRKQGMEPTIVVDVKADDILMEGEIFGPILPIMAVKDMQEAIEFINARDHPLVLYAFSEDEKLKRTILNATMSGNVAFNDTFQQLAISELPFGGVGESGHGRQFMKYSFDLFSYERSIVDIPAEFEKFLEVRYPPYTQEALEFMSTASKLKIPESSAPAFEGKGGKDTGVKQPNVELSFAAPTARQ